MPEPQVGSMTRSPGSVAIKMLYHMSKDDESKSKIAFSGAIPWVMQLIMKWPAGKIVEELGALHADVLQAPAGESDLPSTSRYFTRF